MSKRSTLLEAAKQVERCGARIRHADDYPIVAENIEQLESVIETLRTHIDALKALDVAR